MVSGRFIISLQNICGSVWPICVVNHCWQLNCSACRSSKHEDVRRADQWPIYNAPTVRALAGAVASQLQTAAPAPAAACPPAVLHACGRSVGYTGADHAGISSDPAIVAYVAVVR